jgi:hypothetical protein
MNQLLRVAAFGAMLITSLHSHAFDFSVSTASEFQSALTTAASNGGDDVITLAPGVYPGNFKYLASEAYALTIQGDPNAKREDVILDGERRAFVLRVDAREYDMSLTIRNLTVANGKSDEPGGGLSLFGGAQSNCGGLSADPLQGETAAAECYQAFEATAGSLLLSNLVIRDNFSKDGAGVAINVTDSESIGFENIRYFGSVRVEKSTFVNNGAYFPPSTGNNFGSGATTGHLSALAFVKSEVVDNEFLALAEPLNSDVSSPRLASFDTVLKVSAGGIMNVTNNSFRDVGAIKKVTYPDGTDGYEQVQIIRTANSLAAISTSSATFGSAIDQQKLFEGNSVSGFYGSAFFDEFGGNFVGAFLGNKFVDNYTEQVSRIEGTILNNVFELDPGGALSLKGEVSRNTFRELRGPITVGLTYSDSILDGSTDSSPLVVFTENLVSGLGKSASPKNEETNESDPLDTPAGSGSFDEVGQDYCAVFFDGGRQLILNNTVARTAGSGLCMTSEEATVANNIVWPLPGVDGGYDIQQIGYADKSVLVNNIFQTATEFWDVNEGNLNLDPQYFDVEAGDLHVRAGSPAINAGAGDQLSADQVYDLDGNARVLDGVVDIGAYERSTTALHPADTNGDNEISSEEFAA